MTTPSSAPRLRPPYRAEHVGSLVRPKELYEKYEQFEQGKVQRGDPEFARVENEAVRHVVELQKKAGIKTLTDGEVRRAVFFEGVFDKLEGMTFVPQRPINEFKPYIPHVKIWLQMGVPHSESFFCSGKIKRTTPFYVDQFNALKAVVPPEDVKNIKVTMCSPSWIHQRHGSDLTYDLSVYKNDQEYFDDLGVAYRAEIKELYEAGCRYVQFDDPTFCFFCSEDMISGMEQLGVDHRALLDEYIRAINICIQDRPSDLTVSVHMCRGNFRGFHFMEGSYERVAKKIFEELNVDVYYMEYDTERAGDFQPLRSLPPNKTVVLGLVSTKNPELETVDSLKARVNEAVDVLCQGQPDRSREQALNQLCISSQCGFASSYHGNPGMTEEVEEQKLSLLVETAKQIWPDA